MTKSLLTNCCGGNGRRAIGIGQAQHEWPRDIARNLVCHVSLGSRGILPAVIPGGWLSGADCHPAEDEGEAIGSRNERPETEFLVFDLVKKGIIPERHSSRGGLHAYGDWEGLWFRQHRTRPRFVQGAAVGDCFVNSSD